jgi:hypothetical protein
MAAFEDLIRPVPATEFLAMKHRRHLELQAGVIREKVPRTAGEDELAGELSCRLAAHARNVGHGHVSLGTQFFLKHNPDSVLIADVALIDSLPVPEFGAPKLAVRIVPLEESWEEAEQRMELFLQAGTEAVWLVSEAARCINVRTLDAQRIYERHETLDGGEFLPGFHMPLTEVFETWTK